jgi:AP2 domain.
MSNHISSPDDSYIRVPLGYNKFALIDREDAVIVVQWRCRAQKLPGGKIYVNCHRTIDGVREDTTLHRLLMQPPPDMDVDHRNGDSLDCRRENMRICTQQQNTFNRRKRRDSRQPYVGIRPAPNGIRWYAYISCDRKQTYLGSFATPEEAARAYDAKAKETRGEFAYLNFPEEEAA